ncbi:MAG: sensor domain-containing diguanylate cyclase [Vulcanimicrobiaceae bacterium]
MDLDAELPLPDFGRTRLSGRTRTIALVMALFLATLAIAGAATDWMRTTRWDAFLPICTTLWFVVQSLTALLLFGQFFITRAIGFAFYACAYELAALLVIPYLASVPGIVPALGIDPANRQLTGALWACWHLTFPILVAAGLIVDPTLRRRTPAGLHFGRVLLAASLATFAFALGLTATVWTLRHGIPAIVRNGHPTAYYRHELAPLVALVNGTVCALAVLRGRHVALGLWLGLATFAAMLDAIVNASANHAYSFAWYLAKGATTLTATVVFTMLVVEIAGLYRRLADLATRDPLTGLSNRRGLEEYSNWAFNYARRRGLPIGLLVVDIDHFKRYNDAYGHSAGDIALRRVARVVRESTLRRYDLAARYGGEEFVLAVVDVTMPQLVAIARRLQERLNAARIAHATAESGYLSVSIGIALGADVSLHELFATADRALFEAKNRGRNRFVVGESVTPAG